jgi:hypothetical protein
VFRRLLRRVRADCGLGSSRHRDRPQDPRGADEGVRRLGEEPRIRSTGSTRSSETSRSPPGTERLERRSGTTDSSLSTGRPMFGASRTNAV